jgi:TolB-like protein/DNA-binding winged helix-turn-helix (wHTH) protein
VAAFRERAFCFAEYTLDLGRGCLRSGDREIDLRPKCFALLCYLVENAGRLVPKEELMETIWPNVVVSDESLARCVSDVRHALNDGEQRLIKTALRRGYLFAAPVTLVAPADGASPAIANNAEMSLAVPRSTRRTNLGRSWLVVAGVAAALMLAVGIFWTVFRPAHFPEVAGTVAPLSIVVLPFANLSGDPTQDYLADVITDELTTSLSRIRGSFVIARSTAFTYKGKAIDVKQIARDLGVRYVLEGSEQQRGNRVRVSAQLISADTGAHLWADQFDTDRADLLTMQDEIVTRLARALEIEISAIEAARIARTRPADQAAEDLALRCQAGVNNSFSVGTAERDAAYDLCERALQIDGRNVLALSIAAYGYALLANSGLSADRQADIRQGEDLVARALALEPDNYRAHHAKSVLLIAQKRHEEALVEAERSLALNASFIPAYNALCLANNLMSRPDATLEIADRAIRLSPRDPGLYFLYWSKGLAYSMLKEDPQAIEWLRRSVALAPQFRIAQRHLAAELALNGEEREAHEVLQHYLSLNPPIRTIAQARAYKRTVTDNQSDRLVEGLRKAGMPEE